MLESYVARYERDEETMHCVHTASGFWYFRNFLEMSFLFDTVAAEGVEE